MRFGLEAYQRARVAGLTFVVWQNLHLLIGVVTDRTPVVVPVHVYYAAPMRSTIARTFQQAIALQKQGNLAAAADACRIVVEQAPAEPDPLHLLGLIRKQQGQLEDAERLLRASISLAPSRPHYHANLGNLLSKLQRFEEAEQCYRRALRHDGQFRAARLGLARALSEAGSHIAAEQEARLLTAADSADAEAFSALGVALSGQARYPEAADAYRRALAIAPTYGAARHNLGALLAKMEKIEESLVELDRATAAGVRGAEIDFNRASALMKLYRFEEGEALLRSSIARSPSNADAQKLLAQFRFMRGDSDFASDLAAATAAHPGDAALQLAYGQVLHGANRIGDAEETLRTALHYCPNSRLLGLLATVYQEGGRFDEALATAQRAVAVDPEDDLLSDYVIDALMSLGRADEALPLIAAARKRLPTNQWYIAVEATAARLLGNPRYEYLCDYSEMIRIYELDPPDGWNSMDAFHQDLLPVLRARHKFQQHPLDQSLRSGTQTPRNLIGDPDPVIQGFISALHKPIAAYREAIGRDRQHPLRSRNSGRSVLTGCWSVRLKKGGFHVNHVHPEGWISSAYYAEVPEEVADEDAKSGWIKFGETRYPVPGAEVERLVQPVAGRLVLFPSYLWHGTTPIHGDKPRMTLAFDVVTSPVVP